MTDRLKKPTTNKKGRTGAKEPSRKLVDRFEEFAENARGDEDEDDGRDAMIVESEVPKPDAFRQQIFENYWYINVKLWDTAVCLMPWNQRYNTFVLCRRQGRSDRTIQSSIRGNPTRIILDAKLRHAREGDAADAGLGVLS